MATDITSYDFYVGLTQHKLMASRSLSTGQLFLPPRPLDPKDMSTEMEWVELSGKGKLLTFTVIYVGTSAMIAAGYDRKNPYCVGIVQTDEGPAISAQIMDLDLSHPELIQIGLPLEVVYLERGEGEAKKTFLGFKPAA
jgi:uncharacterized OB-fold protein